ncbi:hypothetical protein [Acinetobacter sp. ANC 4910]|nr:hypothetical protein [Acinetobacter sp. ANC 4910]
MNNILMAQNRLDKICYQRIQSPDFAQKPTLLQKIFTTIKGAAK